MGEEFQLLLPSSYKRMALLFAGKLQAYSSDLLQGGLEVPYLLTFSGNSKEIAKVGLAKKQLESSKEPKKSIETVLADLEVNFPEQWLSYNSIRLTAGELTDKHNDFSTSLIKKDHTNLSGLESTLILNYIKNPVVTPALHILHCRGNHQILVTNIGCTLGKVKVFDSIYFTLYQETLKLIYSIMEQIFSRSKLAAKIVVSFL